MPALLQYNRHLMKAQTTESNRWLQHLFRTMLFSQAFFLFLQWGWIEATNRTYMIYCVGTVAATCNHLIRPGGYLIILEEGNLIPQNRASRPLPLRRCRTQNQHNNKKNYTSPNNPFMVVGNGASSACLLPKMGARHTVTKEVISGWRIVHSRVIRIAFMRHEKTASQLIDCQRRQPRAAHLQLGEGETIIAINRRGPVLHVCAMFNYSY